MHFVTGSLGPMRVYRFRRPALLEGRPRCARHHGRSVSITRKRDSHPAFNLALRVNFVCGGGETSGFEFTGSEGVMRIAHGVTVTQASEGNRTRHDPRGLLPRDGEEDYRRDTARSTRRTALTAENLRSSQEEEYLPPHGYSDDFAHHTTFFAAVRSREARGGGCDLRLARLPVRRCWPT